MERITTPLEEDRATDVGNMKWCVYVVCVCVCVCVCALQLPGVQGARYNGVGCGVPGIQRLHVCLWTDRIWQDLHHDGRTHRKLPSLTPFYARATHPVVR